MVASRLFGPYGTPLADLGREINEPSLGDPVSVLNGRACGEAVTRVATGYIEEGADIGTVNGFGLRGLLHQSGELRTYRQALQGQHSALQAAILQSGQQVRQVISFGPQGHCYLPEEAPNAVEAEDFHGIQAAEAKELNVDAAWFETVTTIQEAVGIAKAAQHHKVECVISFVLGRDGKLRSGESLIDAIRAVDSASGNHPTGYSVNCCPIEALEPALQSLGKYADRMIAAYPNASSRDPLDLEGQSSVGLINSLRTATYLSYLADRYRLKIIGGCCGYSGRDIARVTAAVQGRLHSPILPPTDLL